MDFKDGDRVIFSSNPFFREGTWELGTVDRSPTHAAFPFYVRIRDDLGCFHVRNAEQVFHELEGLRSLLLGD